MALGVGPFYVGPDYIIIRRSFRLQQGRKAFTGEGKKGGQKGRNYEQIFDGYSHHIMSFTSLMGA